MKFTAKNNREIILRKLHHGDYDALVAYLHKLTPETIRRFGPHAFDKETITQLYANGLYTGYIAHDVETSSIVAYCIIKAGFLEHDSSRLQSYGLMLNKNTDSTFAPSVADEWQSQGIGNALFNEMITDLKNKGIKRIILWGGVQSDNCKAINFYLKNGFVNLGEFEYNGRNIDMAAELS